MRDDFREQLEADEEFNNQPAESKFDINSFMLKNYPTINKFELSDVQDKYKKTFGMTIKQTDLKQMIESTKRFKITVIHHKMYVNRL